MIALLSDITPSALRPLLWATLAAFGNRTVTLR